MSKRKWRRSAWIYMMCVLVRVFQSVRLFTRTHHSYISHTCTWVLVSLSVCGLLLCVVQSFSIPLLCGCFCFAAIRSKQSKIQSCLLLLFLCIKQILFIYKNLQLFWSFLTNPLICCAYTVKIAQLIVRPSIHLRVKTNNNNNNKAKSIVRPHPIYQPSNSPITAKTATQTSFTNQIQKN